MGTGAHGTQNMEMNKAIASPSYRSLVEWLRQSRINAGLTQRDVGLLINEPHTFVQKVERLERRLDIFEYVELCKALKVNPVEGLQMLF